MAAAGHQAEEILTEIVSKNKGSYIVAVEGNPPLNEDGMYCFQGGKPFVEKLKWVAQGCQGDHRLGLVCVVGLRAGRQTEPDVGDGPVHQVITDKPVIKVPGLPADRRGDGGGGDLHGRVRQAARARPSGPAEGLLRPAHPRQVLSPAALRRRPVRREVRRRVRRARATASTRWAARVRRRTTRARRCAGTRACRSRSSRGTAASAARRRTSGTRAASTTD